MNTTDFADQVVNLPDLIRNGRNPWVGTVAELIEYMGDRDMTEMVDIAVDSGLLTLDDDGDYVPEELDRVLPKLLATNIDALRSFADDPNADHLDLLGTDDGGRIDDAADRSGWDEVWWDFDADDRTLTVMWLDLEWQHEHETHGPASWPFWHKGQFHHGQCSCGQAFVFSTIESKDITIDKLLGAMDQRSMTSPFAALALDALPSIEDEWETYAMSQMGAFLRSVEQGHGDMWEILDDHAAEYEQGIYLGDDGNLAYATPFDSIPLTGSPELVAKAVEVARAILAANDEDDEEWTS